MKIRNAQYEVSNSKVEKCPDINVPEYAFIGRSNVGKSSLINMLTSRKSLAKTSQKPGKTLLIIILRSTMANGILSICLAMDMLPEVCSNVMKSVE